MIAQYPGTPVAYAVAAGSGCHVRFCRWPVLASDGGSWTFWGLCGLTKIHTGAAHAVRAMHGWTRSPARGERAAGVAAPVVGDAAEPVGQPTHLAMPNGRVAAHAVDEQHRRAVAGA